MIALEPRAPYPWPYAVVPFYVENILPPVDPRFRVNGVSGLDLFGLTEDEKTQLADRVAKAANGASNEDVRTLLQSIATADDRTEVGLLAVQQGGAADKIIPVVADVNNASAGVTSGQAGLSTGTKIGIGVAIAVGIVAIGFGISRARRL